MNKVSVIIPNYNGRHFLAPCLDALDRQTMKDFDIFVVDNGSTDGSLEFLSEHHPNVKVIAFKENTGFCKAVNAGVLKSASEYVILLNNDTIPEEDFVRELYKAINSDEKLFACGACMLSAADPFSIDSAGDLYNALGWAFARGKGRKAVKYNKAKNVFSVCAGAAIYRRRLFVEVGLLDENHFAYLEDMDICYRARIRGYKNRYIPRARVIHVGSGTSGSVHNEFKVRLSSRNNVYLIYKNMPAVQRIINAPFLFAGFTVKKLYFSKKGFGEIYRNGLKEGKRLANSEAGRAHRQKYSAKNFKNYFKIQLELWRNMFVKRS